jgi:hypothetical protein
MRLNQLSVGDYLSSIDAVGRWVCYVVGDVRPVPNTRDIRVEYHALYEADGPSRNWSAGGSYIRAPTDEFYPNRGFNIPQMHTVLCVGFFPHPQYPYPPSRTLAVPPCIVPGKLSPAITSYTPSFTSDPPAKPKGPKRVIAENKTRDTCIDCKNPTKKVWLFQTQTAFCPECE